MRKTLFHRHFAIYLIYSIVYWVRAMHSLMFGGCGYWHKAHIHHPNAFFTTRYFIRLSCFPTPCQFHPFSFCCTSKSIQMSVTWQVLNIPNVNRGQQNSHRYCDWVESFLGYIQFTGLHWVNFLIPFKFRWVCAIFFSINLVIHLMHQRLLPSFLVNVICTTELQHPLILQRCLYAFANHRALSLPLSITIFPPFHPVCFRFHHTYTDTHILTLTQLYKYICCVQKNTFNLITIILSSCVCVCVHHYKGAKVAIRQVVRYQFQYHSLSTWQIPLMRYGVWCLSLCPAVSPTTSPDAIHCRALKPNPAINVIPLRS